MFAAENRALDNFTFDTKMVRHFVLCGRECTMITNCKSVNYFKTKKICQLSNSTRVEDPQSFIEHEGSLYFDGYSETPGFSVMAAVEPPPRTSSCKKLLEAGYTASGVYTIYPSTSYTGGLPVYCDMELDGGGWIMLQRRIDGTVDFYEDWAHYQTGFGDLSGEFWLGNEQMASLTSGGSWDLRVDLTDFDGTTAFAKYGAFGLTGANYYLSIGTYDASSTAGDGLGYHRNRPFSTKDNDNDDFSSGSCAEARNGGWWFGYCIHSHLNGEFYLDGSFRDNDGIVWKQWHNDLNPLQASSMKMRETE
ncbi:ficolin-2-like [Asterias amurensis]|uniref:ficolin-2-like n=1 Tax=Asterias amurensis TaxID=7602 RepID=UPI003AB2AE4E